jgi:hypothetical protein
MIVISASMVLTVVVLLGVARMPGAEPIQGLLNQTAERWIETPFEVALNRELDRMMYASQGPMLHHLAMLQIAEKARLARVDAISRELDRRKGWQVPLPDAAYGPQFSFIKPEPQYLSSRAAQARAQSSNELLLITLVTFTMAMIWMLLGTRR